MPATKFIFHAKALNRNGLENTFMCQFERTEKRKKKTTNRMTIIGGVSHCYLLQFLYKILHTFMNESNFPPSFFSVILHPTFYPLLIKIIYPLDLNFYTLI